MEHIEKMKKLIYMPLLAAVIIFILKIFYRLFTYFIVLKYNNIRFFLYIINWQSILLLVISCILPACLIFFYKKKKNSYEFLTISAYVILGISLLVAIILAVQWRAYLNNHLKINDIAWVLNVANLFPGASIFQNFNGSNFNIFLDMLSLGNTVFVAVIAAKLSKTGEFSPKPKYQPDSYANQINARYQPLSAWQGIKTFAGSPAALVSQELTLDKFNNTVLLKLQLKNTGARNIGAIKIDVDCYDPFKTLLGTCSNIVLMDINAAPNILINIASPIALPSNQTRIAEVVLKSVSFTDGSIWENENRNLFEEGAQV